MQGEKPKFLQQQKLKQKLGVWFLLDHKYQFCGRISKDVFNFYTSEEKNENIDKGDPHYSKCHYIVNSQEFSIMPGASDLFQNKVQEEDRIKKFDLRKRKVIEGISKSITKRQEFQGGFKNYNQQKKAEEPVGKAIMLFGKKVHGCQK